MAVSSEESGVLAPAPAPAPTVAAPAPAAPSPEPATGPAAPRYGSNAEILAWLDVLLKGRPEDQEKARTEIALILEARGFVEDAEEAYWVNVQARTADRRAYDRLIDLYRGRRDRLSESLVQRQREAAFPAERRPALPDATANGLAAAELVDWPASPASNGASAADDPAGAAGAVTLADADPPRHGPSAAPAAEPTPLRRPPPSFRATRAASARPGPGEAPAVGEAQPARRQPPAEESPPGAQPAPAAARTAPAAARTAAAGSAAPAAGAVRGPDGVPSGPARRRRRTPLLPNPEPPVPRSRFTTGGLVALQPTTIGAFLLASIGAAALIAFLLLAAERGRAAPAPPPWAGLPARCTEVALRFPGANDPRAAVVAAYRQQGVDVESARPGAARLTPDQAEQVVGGWMAISLLLEHGGRTPPSLVTWLDADTDQPALANAILAGRSLGSMITPEEWGEMKSWPPNSCEGAFLQEPRNAPHVQRIERIVGR